ncbi:transporter [Marinilabilia rubra]|uniref:Transporter n=2 Tax=Marinilabilia rubra TaxID=2162893 RepID=A0A2U2B523_9BACT|nr:transporter [Marinilabilia rubra]
MALEYSRQIKISKNRKAQALLDKKIATAAHLPNLSASGLYFYKPDALEYSLDGGPLPTYKPDQNGELQPNVMINPQTGDPVMGSDGNPVFNMYAMMPDMNLNLGLEGVTSAGIQLEQPVYMGGKIRTANKMAETGIAAADINMELKKSEIIAESDQGYFQYISVKAKKKAAEDYKVLLDSLVASIDASVQEGMATRNDLLKAQVKRNEATLMVQKANSGLQLARMNLCRIIGLPLESKISIDEKLSDNNKTNEIQSNNNSPELRPEYQMLTRAIEMGHYEEKMARSEMLPKVGISAGYNYFGGLEINGRGTEEMAFSAMASVKIPIFKWFEERNKVSKARLQTEAAQMKLEETEKLLQLEIAQARFNLNDAIKRLELTQSALEQAEENLETSRDRFDTGMERLVDLLEAQAQWQEARSNKIDAQTSVNMMHTKYLKATGKLVKL